MAFSLNRAQIIGNVTRDPEVRVAGSSKVATFGVATNLVWTDQTGQRKERAEFHNVVVWRKLAEICEQYIRKGKKIYVEGRLQTRDWEGQDGVKRYRTEIVAENIIMLDRAGQPVSAIAGEENREHGGLAKSGSSEAEQPVSAAAAQEEEISIDDLPF